MRLAAHAPAARVLEGVDSHSATHTRIRGRAGSGQRAAFDASSSGFVWSGITEELFCRVVSSEANEQHYEVPAALYDLMLGNFSKYSSALYPTDSYSDQCAAHRLSNRL